MTGRARVPTSKGGTERRILVGQHGGGALEVETALNLGERIGGLAHPRAIAIRFGIETADGAAARQRIVEGHGVMQCTLPMGAVGEQRHPVAEAGQRERTQLALIGIEGRQAANEISQEFLGSKRRELTTAVARLR